LASLETLADSNPLLEELKRENAYLRRILDALPAAVRATDSKGRIAYFNKAAAAGTGGVPESGTPPAPLYDASGKLTGFVTLQADISGSKQMEQSLEGRLRELAALYRFADTLQRTHSLDEVYNSGLDAIVDALQCARASVMLFDKHGVMRFAAWRGLSDRFRAAVEGRSPWTPGVQDPQPICIEDVESGSVKLSLKETILAEGIRALTFIPLVANGKLIGKFMTYYDEPHRFGTDEVDLAVTVARQLAFGIDCKRAEEALRQNEERLRLATQTGKVGLWEWDIRANHISWTDSLYPLHGVRKEEFDATVESFSALVHPDDRERVHAAIDRTLSDDAPYELEFRVQRPDGQVVWLYANAIVLRDGNMPVRLLGVTFDITERKRTEEALRASEARERARAAEVEAIMEAVPAPIWIARDPDCRTITGNSTSYEILRMKQASNVSLSAEEDERPVHYEVLSDGRPLKPEEMPVQRAARGEIVRDFEMGLRFSDGSSRFVFGNATPLRDASGKPVGSVSAFVDITERKHAEAQRDLLLAELSHRVKNTLATVISIAHQSFSKGPSIEDARRSFDMRIRALAQTHVRLADANWGGVSVERILLDETAPYRREDGANVRISGPSIVLNPKCAVTLGMAIHELTTNAAKYGALSARDGVVDACWEIAADRQLRIRWIESGGPAVTLPKRSGFGRLLLERVLTSDLSGTVDLDFAASGFRCAIAFPLKQHVAHLN
jgi:PAS domain S-box-containing protein